MFLVTVSNFISLSDLHWILPYVSDYRWSVALIWPRLYSMSSKCLSATVWCSSSWLTTCGCVLPSFSGRERAISSSAGSALSWLTSMNTAINKRQCSKHDSKLVIYFFLFFLEFWKNNITGTWTHIFYINFFLSWKKNHMPYFICWRRASRYPSLKDAVSEGSTICWTLGPLSLWKARNCSLLT